MEGRIAEYYVPWLFFEKAEDKKNFKMDIIAAIPGSKLVVTSPFEQI